jgi:hypothetical protein
VRVELLDGLLVLDCVGVGVGVRELDRDGEGSLLVLVALLEGLTWERDLVLDLEGLT